MCWRFVLVASASCPDPTLDSLRVSVRPQAEMAESRFFQNHSLRNANRQRSAMSLMGRSPSIRDMSLPDSGRWLIPRGSASFHACVGGNNTPARPDLFGEAYLTRFELLSAAMSDSAMKPQAMEYLAELPFVSPTAYKMDSYIQLGEYDLALQNIRRIAEFDDTVFTLFWNPLLAHLRQHPDFPELMREAGFVELWEKEGYPDMCRPVGDSFECD